MPETYDVQQRSFIKKPELKCCAACGQPLPSDAKPFSTHMNHYIANVEGAVACTIASNEDTIKTKDGVILYKIDSKTKVANFPKTPVPVASPKVITPAAKP